LNPSFTLNAVCWEDYRQRPTSAQEKRKKLENFGGRSR
jgi:hypothetical protein